MTQKSGSRGTFAEFKETLLAYTFGLGGLIAGFVLVSQLGLFDVSTWAIAVWPAILSAKGVISGLLSGRLGTALHLGTVYPRFFNNTKSFYKMIHTTVVLTLIVSAVMSLISIVFGLIFWGAMPENFLEIVLVVVATMTLGLGLSFVTTKVAFLTFKRGLDPDIVVYPIMATIADMFITLCYILILNVYFIYGLFGKSIIAIIVLFHIILVLYIIPKNYKEYDFRKNLKESLLTLLFVSVIVNITGTVLKSIRESLQNRVGEIITALPSLLAIIGDVGSVVGSTATTKLALGLLRPSFASLRHHARTVLSAWVASIVVFSFLAILSPLINGTLSISTFSNLISILIVANVIAIAGIVLLSFGISILTFQKGLDPDNFVIPIESSFADSLMTIALLLALVLMG